MRLLHTRASGRLGAGAAVLALLSGLGAAARAEEGPAAGSGRFLFELGAFGGVHLYSAEHGLGRYRDDPEDLSPDHGMAFGVRLGFNPIRRLTLEADLLGSPTRTRNDATSIFLVGYRASLLLNLLAEGAFRPFLLAGVGGLSSIVGDETVVDSDSDGFLHAGLGAKVLITPRLGVRVDARVLVPPAVASDVLRVGDETLFGGPDLEILAGLYWSLGEVRRPPPAAPLPPPPPAPPLDPDGDGITGDADRCPTDPEDKDGFEDDDGCPEPDNDGDGIPDTDDRCPLRPETRNGVDDEDGCPEEDTDGDGFLGSRDKCPDAPETVNNYQDDDGCPDEVPAQVRRFTGVIEGISFKTNSAEILKGSYAVLDRAVDVLKEYPDVKLEISGHTDNRGSAEYNRALSERRAQAVREYLVSKGVAPERLIAVGHGFDRPIADNTTASGRARNRRTEFRLVSDGER